METNQLPRAGEIIKSAWKSYKLFSKKMWPFYILGSIGLLAGVGYSNVSSLVQPIFQSHIGDTAKMLRPLFEFSTSHWGLTPD